MVHPRPIGKAMVHLACTSLRIANLQHPIACGLLATKSTQGVTRLLSLGKSTVSLTFFEPVRTINKRATPNPHPA